MMNNTVASRLKQAQREITPRIFYDYKPGDLEVEPEVEPLSDEELPSDSVISPPLTLSSHESDRVLRSHTIR